MNHAQHNGHKPETQPPLMLGLTERYAYKPRAHRLRRTIRWVGANRRPLIDVALNVLGLGLVLAFWGGMIWGVVVVFNYICSWF